MERGGWAKPRKPRGTANSTVSIHSQRHPGKFPKVPGRSRGLGVAFQAPPGSQASSRGEAKDSALLSSRDAGLLDDVEKSDGGK